MIIPSPAGALRGTVAFVQGPSSVWLSWDVNPNRRSSVCPPQLFAPLYALYPTSHSVSLPRLLQPAPLGRALCWESQLLGLNPDSAASLRSGFGSHTPSLCLFAVSLLGYKKNIWCWFLLCDAGVRALLLRPQALESEVLVPTSPLTCCVTLGGICFL